MPKAMTAADWTARGEAYTEAAEHLGLSWTENAKERDQGNVVAGLLRREAEKCHRIAAHAHTAKV